MDNNPFFQNAANAFMTIRVTVRKAPKWKTSKQASSASAENLKTADGVPVSTQIGSLGSMTEDLAAVISKFDKVRTYYYENAGQMKDEDGNKLVERLVNVTQVPEVLTKLHKLKAIADNALEQFKPRYREFYDARRNTEFGAVRDVSLPDPDTLFDKFEAVIYDPLPVLPLQASQIRLPAEQAAQIAARQNAKLEQQIANAKSEAIKNAREHMLKIEKQATEGQRLSPSLLEHAETHAKQLEGITVGYDNDPAMLELVKLIREQISSLTHVHQIRRPATVRAAQTVAKGLSDIAKRDKSAVTTPVTDHSNIQVGGLLADLID